MPYPPPASLDPLPNHLRNGLIAPGMAGVLSATSTFTITLYILLRHRGNQYIILVLNLLIADLQQASSFLISWYWISQNKIAAPTAACFAQGWLIHSGNISGGFFVLAIAIHTLLTACLGWKIRASAFYAAIAFAWIAAYTLTAIGVGLHPTSYFVRAGAWCWVSSEYPDERLYLRYLWIFLCQFSTILIYTIIFVVLRRKTHTMIRNYREKRDAANPHTIRAINRITRLMTLYPLVYVILTLPLSSGRMWSMAHDGAPTSDAFSLGAGTLLASCGWVHSLLYTLTRRGLMGDSRDDVIFASRQVIVQDHGSMPKQARVATGTSQEGQNKYGGFGETAQQQRESGLLIETPSPTEPSLNGVLEDAGRTVAHDWANSRPISSTAGFYAHETMPCEGIGSSCKP